ncbi:unnamed protein product [Phytomonas sp. EM1]|nr:unnamed protein product [Phytomonas sp. EM1]|eukprot:CCW63845.1 unnamed protein product [Phytomonas sp. isolate EM1]
MNQQLRGQPVRFLVVVERRYLAARVVLPRAPEDVFLAPETVRAFSDIRSVLSEDGGRFVDLENGATVPRHLFLQLSTILTHLLPFDKPAQPTKIADVRTADLGEVIQEMMVNRPIFDAVADVIREDSEFSTNFFIRLVQEACSSVAGSAGAPKAPNEGENDTQEEQATSQTAEETAEGSVNPANPTSAPSTAVVQEKGPKIALLASPQGCALLKIVLAQRSKRRAFFEYMQQASSADSPSGAEELFKSFFAGILTSRFVFQSFGLRLAEDDAGEESPTTPAIPREDSEVDVLCGCFARYGITVVSGNGGSCMVASLIRALRPKYRTFEVALNRRDRNAPPGSRGVKRGREGREPDDAAPPPAAPFPHHPQPRTEEDGKPDPHASHAPASLAEYHVPEPPLDWRFFYAVASSFSSGQYLLSGLHPHPHPHPHPNAARDPAEEAATPAPLTRVQLLAEHIVACRTVQVMIPHFADAILAAEKRPVGSPSHDAFVAQCSQLLKELANRVKELVVHNYGNYVAQTFFLELAPRAVPGSEVENTLRIAFDAIVANIFSMSMQKFASNCVERAIIASANVAEGRQIILRLAKSLLERGEMLMVQVASHQFGNYVVRHICEQLTAFTAADAATISDGERQEAGVLEGQFLTWLSAHRTELQQTPYGVGLVNWMNNKRRSSA